MSATSGGPGPQPPDGGRYRFEGRIATGGMGEVWRATDQVLGRQVAVKVLKPEYSDDPTFRSRFETEARNAAALHHPNVASVFDFGELPVGDDGVPRPYLVMELVRGEPLSALLRGDEPMPSDTAADLVAQAADGLAAAHDLGIVHRDIKPANLLVTPDRTVKITDFGIARAGDAVALTQTGQVIGTPQYLSPEQAEGKRSTGASDIYSLGVVLYECLAGRRPFEADSPIATALAHLRQEPPPLPDDVPVALRRTVAVALAKDPGARFASVRDFATALRGGPIQGGAPTAVVEDDAPTRVATGIGPAAGMAGAGLAGAAGGATRPGRTERDAAWNTDRRFDESGAGGRTIAPPPDGDGPSRGRIPPWVLWVAAAVAVLVVILLFTKLRGGQDTPTSPSTSTPSASSTPSRSSTPSPPSSPPTKSSSPSPSTPTSTAPDQIDLNEGDYVGRSRNDAVQDLKRLGLNVTEQQVDNPGDEQKDTVSAVSPSGQVDEGSTVTVSYYGDPVPTQTPTTSGTSPGGSPTNGKGDGKGKKKP